MVAVENLKEHKDSLPFFLARIIFFGMLGSVVGGANEWLMQKLQGARNTKLYSAVFIVTQLALIGLEFYVIFRYTQKNTVVFDDWLWNTFAGFIYGVTLFSGQDGITANIKNIFSIT
jgi:hypothetical protein